MIKNLEASDTSATFPQDLRDTLRSAQRDHQTSFDALRDAVWGYVDELRRRGIKREEILRAVERLVAELDGQAARSSDDVRQNARTIGTIMEWCDERLSRPLQIA